MSERFTVLVTDKVSGGGLEPLHEDDRFTIVQVDDTPTYDLFVIRSLARSFAHAIEHACHEFASD